MTYRAIKKYLKSIGVCENRADYLRGMLRKLVQEKAVYIASDIVYKHNEMIAAKQVEEKPILIFAGDFKQAEWLARHLRLPELNWRYIYSPCALEGRAHGSVVLYFGTYWRRPVEVREFVRLWIYRTCSYGLKVLDR